MVCSFGDSTGNSILNGLVAVDLGDVHVQERKISVLEFSMNYRCSACRCIFEVKDRTWLFDCCSDNVVTL